MAAAPHQPSLAVLRIAVSGLMLAKSLPPLSGASASIGPGLLMPIAMTALGVPVLIGFATRIVGWLAALLMAFIYVAFHAPVAASPAANGGVPAILSACIFAHLALAGPGPWSIDHARRRAAVQGGGTL